MNSRRTRLRSAIAVTLTVLVLVPMAILFGRDWQDTADRRDRTALEQKGVQYVTALTPLLNALVGVQSSALQGLPAAPDALQNAIARVSAVDADLGDQLSTKPRWASLQEQIGKLSKIKADPTRPTAVYDANAEVADLTVALYNAARRNSGLNRDPDYYLSNLQQAVAVDMPTTIVQVNRMGDLANLLQSLTGAARQTTLARYYQSVVAVQAANTQLTDDLQASISDKDSSALSGGLVSALDSFRRGVESLTRGAVAGNPNAATIAIAQSSLQGALNNLSSTTLKEMDRLLDNRMNDLDYRRGEALVVGLAALLLVLAAVLWPRIGRRREPEPVGGPSAPIGESTRDVNASRSVGSPYGAGRYDQAPTYGETNQTRRERSGALR
jgi:hypothetical protein